MFLRHAWWLLVWLSLCAQVVVFKFLKLVTEPFEAGRSLARGALSQDRTVPLQRTPYFTAFSHDDVNASTQRSSAASGAGAGTSSSSSFSSSKVVSSAIGGGQMQWAGNGSGSGSYGGGGIGGGRRRSSTTDDAMTGGNSTTNTWQGGTGAGAGKSGQNGNDWPISANTSSSPSSHSSSFDWGPVTLSSISPIAIVHGRPIETLQLLRTVLCLLLPPLWCPDGARGLPGLKDTLSAWINRHASNRFIDLSPVRM